MDKQQSTRYLWCLHMSLKNSHFTTYTHDERLWCWCHLCDQTKVPSSTVRPRVTIDATTLEEKRSVFVPVNPKRGKTLQLTSSPVVEVTRSVQSQRGPGQPRIVPVRHPLNRACRVDSVFVLDKFYRTANDVNKFVRHAVNIGNPSACQPVRVHYKMQRQ